MNERSIFMEALAKESPPERSAYLDEACGGDAALRQRVEALLASHEDAGSFLGKPVPERLAEKLAGPVEETRGQPAPAEEDPGGASSVPRTAAEGLGSRIGPYKLLQEIGEGGMGTVYLAEQNEPVRRMVALKIIKPAMDSRHVIARFEAERQALALMDHPNIARVLDGGAMESGRPYFVMELVKGVPITKYCDEHRLTPRQRLELFLPVCQAVQHAHQKGIIHRDIKPSNVMVCLYDGRPVPKVIDFGVAKATGQKLTERTMFTEIGQVVGTLEYMSPEQAELNQLDIDTRSDIYSLGVLLYELLTGSTPLERKRLKSAAMLEVLRLIREEEPPKPSTRLSTTDELPAVAATRGMEPKKLSGLVRGELDWIVMKALEKDRSRRYEAANGFALDIQRYLADEPVLACPPSAWYRLRKFTRRNRSRLAVAGVLALTLLVAVGGIGWGLRDQAARQAKAADDLELALDRAELFQGQGKRSEALAAFERAELLAGQAPADPARDERLAALKERLAAEARDQDFLAQFEKIRLEVQSGVDVAKNKFSHSAAFPELHAALRRYGITIGTMSPTEAGAYVRSRPEPVRGQLVAALDECLWLRGVDKKTREWLAAALKTIDDDPWRMRVRQAWPGRDALKELADEADVSNQPAAFLHALASSLPAPMKSTKLNLLRRTQAAHPADLWVNHTLAVELMENGKPGEAVRYFYAASALRPKNPGIYNNRGIALARAGEVNAAIADFRRAIALAPQYAGAHYGLGRALIRTKSGLDETVAVLREAIRIDKDYADAHYILASALALKGELDEAIAEYRKTIRIRPDDHRAHNDLGVALRDKGQLDDAIAEYREALRLKKDLVQALVNLGAALKAKGLIDDAIVEYRKALRFKPDSPLAHHNLGSALKAKGKLDEAIAEFREAIRLDKDMLVARINLANALRVKGRLDEAILEYRQALRIKKDDALARTNLGITLADKGNYYRTLGKLDKAVAHFSEALKLHPKLVEAWAKRGNCYLDLGEHEKAATDLSQAIVLNPKLAEAWTSRGYAHLRLGQGDKAVSDFTEAIALETAFAGDWYGRGQAYGSLGRYPEALADYRKAIKLLPTRARLHAALAWLLATCPEPKLRDPAEALKAARKSVELDSKDGQCWSTLGIAHYSAGDWKSAISAFETSLKLTQGGDAIDFFFLAMAHKKLARHAEARTYYDKARAWLEKNQEMLAKDRPFAEEVRRFRSEAEHVLQVNKK